MATDTIDAVAKSFNYAGADTSERVGNFASGSFDALGYNNSASTGYYYYAIGS